MEHRLPRSVVPTRYDLRLQPDLKAATFAGEEIVSVTVREPVDEIVLNAVELSIQEVTARSRDGALLAGTAELDPDAAAMGGEAEEENEACRQSRIESRAAIGYVADTGE